MHRFPPDKALPVVENVEKRAFMHKELWKSRNLLHFYVVSYLWLLNVCDLVFYKKTRCWPGRLLIHNRRREFSIPSFEGSKIIHLGFWFYARLSSGKTDFFLKSMKISTILFLNFSFSTVLFQSFQLLLNELLKSLKAPRRFPQFFQPKVNFFLSQPRNGQVGFFHCWKKATIHLNKTKNAE